MRIINENYWVFIGGENHSHQSSAAAFSFASMQSSRAWIWGERREEPFCRPEEVDGVAPSFRLRLEGARRRMDSGSSSW